MYQGPYPGAPMGEVQIRMKVDIYTEGPNDGLDFYQSVNTGHPDGAMPNGHRQHFQIPPSISQGSNRPMIQWPESSATSESDRNSEAKRRRKKKHRDKERDTSGSMTSLSTTKNSVRNQGAPDPVPRRRRRSRDELPDPLAYQRVETPSHPRTDHSSEDTLQTSKDDSFETDPPRQPSPMLTRPRTFERDFPRATADPIISYPSEPENSQEDIEPLIVTPQDVTINTFEQQSVRNSQLSAPPRPSSSSSFSFGSDHLRALLMPTRSGYSGGNNLEAERRLVRQIDERITTTTMKFSQIQAPSSEPDTSFEERPLFATSQYPEPWAPSYTTRPYSRNSESRKPEAPPRQLRVSFSSLPDSREASPTPTGQPHIETLIDDPASSFEEDANSEFRSYGTRDFNGNRPYIPQLESEPRALRPSSSAGTTPTETEYRGPPEMPARSSQGMETSFDDATLPLEELPRPPKEVSHVRRETLIDDVIEIDCEETYSFHHTESSMRDYRAPPVGRSDEDRDSSLSSIQQKGIALTGGSIMSEDETISRKSSDTEVGECQHEFRVVEDENSPKESDRDQPENDSELGSVRDGRFGWIRLPKRISFHEPEFPASREDDEPPRPGSRPLSSAKIFDIYTKPVQSSTSNQKRPAQKPPSPPVAPRVPLATQEDDHVADSASDASYRRSELTVQATSLDWPRARTDSNVTPTSPNSFQPRAQSRSSANSRVVQPGKVGAVYANPEYLDENLSDYLQARLSPLGKEMGQYADSTLSKDSVVSEASYRNDRSHGFFDRDEPVAQARAGAAPRSFAEIMSAAKEDRAKKGKTARQSGSTTSLSSYGSLRQDSVRHAPVLNRPPMGDLGRGGLYGEAKIGMAQLGKDQVPFTDRWDAGKKHRGPTAL